VLELEEAVTLPDEAIGTLEVVVSELGPVLPVIVGRLVVTGAVTTERLLSKANTLAMSQ